MTSDMPINDPGQGIKKATVEIFDAPVTGDVYKRQVILYTLGRAMCKKEIYKINFKQNKSL